MLFRVNMYRQGREKRLEAVRRVHRTAIFAVVLSVNVVVIGLFTFAVLMSDRGIAAAEVRLSATEQALDKVVSDQGGSTTESELGLFRLRAERVLWSRVMETIAGLTPKEMWLPRIRLSESDIGGGLKIQGLRISGRMNASSEEDGMRILMGLVNGLRADAYFREHFLEPRLVRSTWLTEEGKRFLEFDAFTPLKTPEAMQSGASMIPDSGWDTIDDADVETEEYQDTQTGAGSERTS
ncbi:MAG: hypothetical protein GF400_05030 [Candidatus Eisenbacteria bacterium]|nr:hypothetical protein [Candidatus Eisenbacteria bacterium]